jgi:ABC-2 type transport system permease protein
VKVILAVMRRELRALFNSPRAGLLGACFLLLSGAMGVFNLDQYLRSVAQLALRMRGMGAEPIVLDFNEHLLRQDLGGLSVLVLLYLPLLAMNLLAEERRSGTLELLMTSPVGDGRLILGKWLAAQLHFVALLLLAAAPKLLFAAYAPLHWPAFLLGLAGIALMCGAFLALLLFLGSLTRSPLVAAGAGFGLLLLLWFLGGFAQPGATGFPGGFLLAVSALGHLAPLVSGLLDSADLVYFVIVTLIGLELARRSLQGLRGGGR